MVEPGHRFKANLTTRTGKRISLDGADDLIDALRDRFHQFGNGQRVLRGADRMPVVGKKYPGGQEERMKSAPGGWPAPDIGNLRHRIRGAA